MAPVLDAHDDTQDTRTHSDSQRAPGTQTPVRCESSCCVFRLMAMQTGAMAEAKDGMKSCVLGEGSGMVAYDAPPMKVPAPSSRVVGTPPPADGAASPSGVSPELTELVRARCIFVLRCLTQPGGSCYVCTGFARW